MPSIYNNVPACRSSHSSRNSVNDATLASAQNESPFSGPPLNYIVTELGRMTPGMLSNGVRKEGHAVSEKHQAHGLETKEMGKGVIFCVDITFPSIADIEWQHRTHTALLSLVRQLLKGYG